MQVTLSKVQFKQTNQKQNAQKSSVAHNEAMNFKGNSHQISHTDYMNHLQKNLSPNLMQKVEKELEKRAPRNFLKQLSFGKSSPKFVYSLKKGNPEVLNILDRGDEEAGALLGGKGKNLAVMKSQLGLPVPPASTITSEACLEYLGIKNLSKALKEEVAQELKANGNENEKQVIQKVVIDEVMEQVNDSMTDIEKETGFKFGKDENPLLVSVRSGAKISMPGMMDTVLNLGINDNTRAGVQKNLGKKVGLDCERRFLEMFGDVVLGIKKEKFDKELNRIKKEKDVKLDNELDEKSLEKIIKAYEKVYRNEGEVIPTEFTAKKQLQMGVEAVFNSWNGKRAIDYREANNIPHNMGTAVNVQAMVYGNSPGGATAVVTSRNISTGKNVISGDYLEEAQGEDVVNGSRPTHNISEMKTQMPKIYAQLEKTLTKLEKHFGDAQDVELTIQKNPKTGNPELWMLQTRNAKRTGEAAVKIAVDMKNEGLILKDKALTQFDANLLDQVLLPKFDSKDKKAAIKENRLMNNPKIAVAAAPGAASGVVALTPEKAEKLKMQGIKAILIREETTPEDFSGMLASEGILTRSGGTSSHAALVARQFGKACVSSASDIVIDMKKEQITDAAGNIYKEGVDVISVDGAAAQVFKDKIVTKEPDLDIFNEYQTLMKWADEKRTLGIKTNADTPKDVATALKHGAEGIGLTRIEHMFGGKRTSEVQKMIFSSQELEKIQQKLESTKDEKEIQAALKNKEQASIKLNESLKKLGKWVKKDFKSMFTQMKDKPVTIRLIDPPLHEFLEPLEKKLKTDIAKLKKDDAVFNRETLKEKEQQLKTIAELHEVNPMLGTRGVRLGLSVPGLNAMQARAIAEAACEVQKATGEKVKPQIMVPLVINEKELDITRNVIDKEVQAVMKEQGVKDLDYKIGTMIELPRAALTADKIAEKAEFFSLGTNDLTQTTLGYSRDDTAALTKMYVRKGILPVSPFETLDEEGVGSLVKTTVEKGRSVKSNLDIGICGEHGGDPKSINFFHNAGLNYVSCSPLRVPVARLAAAQAAIKYAKKTDK